MTFPLTFEVYKPKEKLKSEDIYQTKPQIAAKMIRYVQQFGFKIRLVLADSLYGESHSTFIRVMMEFQLNYAVATILKRGTRFSLHSAGCDAI
ncbi:MAG: hypothetical protein CLLPBCKN_007030 [Chroococcidiopsis cubana SAG 39.79]|nr:hypothetical protein [Chroococcidiopsis cubana SAG 39.79]